MLNGHNGTNSLYFFSSKYFFNFVSIISRVFLILVIMALEVWRLYTFFKIKGNKVKETFAAGILLPKLYLIILFCLKASFFFLISETLAKYIP